MKKLFAMLLMPLFFLLPNPVAAQPGYEMGITDSQQYTEVVYIGGSPVVFRGTVKIATKQKGSSAQTSLTYKLTGGTKADTLSRSVKLDSTITQNESQERYDTKLSSITESIQVAGQKLKLNKEGNFFTASKVIDHTAAVDYYTENWSMRRSYTVGTNVYLITLEGAGITEGYSNAWGQGSTTTSDMRATSLDLGSNLTAWEGAVSSVDNAVTGRDLRYLASRPELTSFSGGFLDESNSEESINVNYDLPKVTAGIADNATRNRGSLSLNMKTPPAQRRLFVGQFKDIKGHWAQTQIEAMSGLGAFSVKGDFFGPGYAARREDLARGLAVVTNLVKDEPAKKTVSTRKQPAAPQDFVDVPPTAPNYKYIQAVYTRGAMKGTNAGVFSPYKEITRAEAATVLTNALGMKRYAPAPNAPAPTPFVDDADIPAWARESVYIASQIGLMRGEQGSFRPNDVMTRAELAVMLDNYRQYLNQDFRKAYRDRLYTFKS